MCRPLTAAHASFQIQLQLQLTTRGVGVGNYNHHNARAARRGGARGGKKEASSHADGGGGVHPLCGARGESLSGVGGGGEKIKEDARRGWQRSESPHVTFGPRRVLPRVPGRGRGRGQGPPDHQAVRPLDQAGRQGPAAGLERAVVRVRPEEVLLVLLQDPPGRPAAGLHRDRRRVLQLRRGGRRGAVRGPNRRQGVSPQGTDRQTDRQSGRPVRVCVCVCVYVRVRVQMFPDLNFVSFLWTRQVTPILAAAAARPPLHLWCVIIVIT